MANPENAAATLAAQARAAYDQRRMRDCAALIKELLAADPANAEAQALTAAIRADLQQDLRDARGLIEQAGAEDEKRKYRKAAELILIKALYADPDNPEAKMLLQSAKAGPLGPVVKETAAPVIAAPLFTTFTKKEKKKFGLKFPVALIGIGVFAGTLMMLLHVGFTSPKASALPVAHLEPVQMPVVEPQFAEPELPAPTGPPAVVPVSSTPPNPVAVLPPPAPSSPPAIPAPVPTSIPAPVPAPVPVTTPAPDPRAMGELAVSSPISADIYAGSRYLGSTPTTLKLPAGHQTLEFRHGDLRSGASYDIKANDTMYTTVTFQLTVQINARPWAQVYLDGTARLPLGQTPLSGVTVPVGSVLVFENPNFSSKMHRITDQDAAIQVNFP